jgi:hypothetical protein
VGRLRRDRTQPLKALGETLDKYWGAVERDLTLAGFTWDDVGSERFPVSTFVAFTGHAPPNSSLYHERSEGWTVTDHLLAQVIDALNKLVWFKTKDAQSETPKHRPDPVPRPGMKIAKPDSGEKPMTVADYAQKAGIRVNLE